MSSQLPPPPPRFTSGGGYHEVNIGYDNTIFPMRQDDDQQQEHHYHYEQQQQQQHMMDTLTHEAKLQHKIAQSMLTPRADSNNNHNNTAINEDDILFGMDDVPITFMNPPPWEESISDHHHHGGGGAAQFPAMAPFPTSDVMNDPVDDAVSEPAVAATPAETAHTNYYNNNNGPSSTKSVTFNTHDEFHSWDEQLDQLLHVDEEFFNVAHFLLEVVNVGSVMNFEDEFIGRFEEEEEDYGGGGGVAQAVALTPVNDGIGSILARFFTFECGNAQDVDSNEYGSTYQMSNNSNNNNTSPGEKKYKLTKKLVQDFEKALKFRMGNIESNESLLMSGGTESELIIRTKKIAERVEAYGLPGMPPPDERIPEQQQQQQPYEDLYGGVVGREDAANGPAAYGDCYDVDYDEVEEEFLRTLETSKVERNTKPRHFPILPTDDDEDAFGRGGMNEDERRFYNTFGNLSSKMKQSEKRNSQSPFKSVCKLFSTLVGPKTSTPSREECQIRLQQIQREMNNAERMMESSRSNEVISACANRIKRLKDEERMYQIFKEISKIQAMMQATESESVKKACSQRLYQLTAELKSIDLGHYDEELDVRNDVVEVDTGPVAKATGGEDLDWYERAQRYVLTQEEPQNPARSSNQNTVAANRQYRPHHLQQQQRYSQQYEPYPGYIPDVENYYERPYPAKQQFASPISPRRALSPRNSRPYPHPQY